MGETQVQTKRIEERKGLKRKFALLAKVIFFAIFKIRTCWSVDYKFQRFLEGKELEIKIPVVSFLGNRSFTPNSKNCRDGRGYEKKKSGGCQGHTILSLG